MLLELLQTITGVFVVVYDGQHALKFTLGRARNVVGPGVHWKWPIVQKFQVQDTRHTTLDLEPQVIQLDDDLVYEVDAKVIYQIRNLHKAIIEIDDLVVGMRNRVVLAIQRVLSSKDRRTIRDRDALIEEIYAELRSMEDQWGVAILQLGFSNISPSPATLEITQLELLARERLALFGELRSAGLAEDSAVALVSGAVVTAGTQGAGGLAEERRALAAARTEIEAEAEAERLEELRDADEVDEDESFAGEAEDEV